MFFVFSKTILTHRKFIENGYKELVNKDVKQRFYNIVCYGNERLYRHLKKSFEREWNSKQIKV